MNKQADDLPDTQHTVVDWLALHELDSVACRRILDAITPEVATARAGKKLAALGRSKLSVEAAWLRTADALRAFFPVQQSIIDETFDKTVKTLVNPGNKPRRALTLDNGPTAFPTIFYSYRGEASDCLTMVHEFAHALQIRASRGQFVAPIIREVCAFIGEWALLCHVKVSDTAEHRFLLQVWKSDNRKFFRIGKDRLTSALLQPETPYTYGWNYPIARYLAIRIFERYSRERMWMLFEGGLSVQSVLRELTFEP